MKAATRRQIRSSAQNPIDLLLHRDEIEQGEAFVIIDEQIDVAVRPGLVTARGAEEVERSHAVRGDLCPVLPQQLDGLTPSHCGPAPTVFMSIIADLGAHSPI